MHAVKAQDDRVVATVGIGGLLILLVSLLALVRRFADEEATGAIWDSATTWWILPSGWLLWRVSGNEPGFRWAVRASLVAIATGFAWLCDSTTDVADSTLLAFWIASLATVGLDVLPKR